jgi:hypothetical protein
MLQSPPHKEKKRAGHLQSTVFLPTLIKKYKEIQMGSGAKSYIMKGFLIYEEMRKFFPMYSMRRPLVNSHV